MSYMKAREYLEFLYNNLAPSESSDGKHEGYPKELTYLMTEFSGDYDIRRKNAAAITHIFIREVLKMPDIVETIVRPKAQELKDLYDCRVCVVHIEQMYAGRIMDARIEKPVKMFGGEEVFTREEASTIVMRINKLK